MHLSLRRTLVCALFGLVLWLPSLPAQTAGDSAIKPEKQDSSERILARQRWFYGPRAFPSGHIPIGARLRALQQRRAMQRTEFAAGVHPAAPASWISVGPSPETNPFYGDVSGRVTAIAVDPTNAAVVYVGAAQGGVWKSTDSGNHWTPLTDTQASLATGSIAIDPNNHNTIFVGLGEQNFSGDSYYGGGVLKSTNAGASWTQLGSATFSTPSYIGGVAVQPGNSNIVLAAAGGAGVYFGSISGGIYRSIDGGSTWANVINGSGSSGNAVLFDPRANGGIAYAAVDSTGVFHSIDNGQTWSALPGSSSHPFPSANVGRIAIAISPTTPTTLYAAVSNGTRGSTFGDLLGIWKSTDSGSNWIQLTNAPDFCKSTHQCWYDLAIEVSPLEFLGKDVIYAGGEEFTDTYNSLDGGNTWNFVQNENISLHPDTHAFAYSADGKHVYAGNDGGIYRSDTPASAAPTWFDLNATLTTVQFYPYMGIAPSGATLGGGTQDNGSEATTGSVTWSDNGLCGDGASVAIDFVNTANVYANCGAGVQIGKSTSGVLGSFISAQVGIPTVDREAFIAPMVMDPANSSILYYGTFRLYQTKTGAAQIGSTPGWSAISPDLTAGGDISCIAAAQSNDNVVYVGTDDGNLQMTSNALASTPVWTDRTPGLPGRAVSYVAVDPHNPALVYVTVSGFGAGHVFRSIDSGNNWTDISGNLPDIPANAVVVDPTLANTLYLGTDVGVFTTNNANSPSPVWSTLQTGLPDVAVLALGLQSSTHLLVAGTHGRGAWTLQVQPPPATHYQVSAPAGAAAGIPFSVTITALTASNTTATSYRGTVHFTSSDPQASLPVDYTFTSADAGVHTFTSIFLGTPGSQTITTTDKVASTINGNATILVSPGPATHFQVTAPASSTAGATFGFSVTALDQFNNTATGYTGAVHFTSTDPQASLPANSTLTSGAGSFTATLKTSTSITLIATDTANSSITGNATVNVSAASATHFSVSVPPTATQAFVFTTVVTAQDAFNNTATGYAGTVHFTSSSTGTLPPNSTLSSGSSSFPVTLNMTGSQSVTATDTVTSSITGTGSLTVVTDKPILLQCDSAPAPCQTLRLFRPTVPMLLASFTYAGSGTLTASINWGDGNTTAGTVQSTGSNSFNVTAMHTYAHISKFAVKVTITSSAGSVAIANDAVSFFPRNLVY